MNGIPMVGIIQGIINWGI